MLASHSSSSKCDGVPFLQGDAVGERNAPCKGTNDVTVKALAFQYIFLLRHGSIQHTRRLLNVSMIRVSRKRKESPWI